MRRTSSALVGFEQTVGIDLSLERRPEGASSGLGCLARVVCRVESVCTDPPAKGPTGPFSLVHLQMLPVLLRRQPPFPIPGGSRWSSCPAGSASDRSVAELMSCLASSFWLRPRMGPRSGGVAWQGLRLCRHRPKWKDICVPSCVPNSPVPDRSPLDTPAPTRRSGRRRGERRPSHTSSACPSRWCNGSRAMHTRAGPAA